MSRLVGMGPSEFESESLAPQARRMVQATPRPRDCAGGAPTGPLQITVCPAGRAGLVDEPPDGDHRAGDDRRVQDRQPEERPQFGPPFLRPDGCLGGGAPRVGGVRVMVGFVAHARTVSRGPAFLTARFVRPYAANHGSRAAGPVGLRTSRWTFAPASPGAYESRRGELVEQEQSVLVRADPQGRVHIDPEPPPQEVEHLLEVDLVRPFEGVGPVEEADHDPGCDPEYLGGRHLPEGRNGPERPSARRAAARGSKPRARSSSPPAPRGGSRHPRPRCRSGQRRSPFARTRPRRRGPRASGRSGGTGPSGPRRGRTRGTCGEERPPPVPRTRHPVRARGGSALPSRTRDVEARSPHRAVGPWMLLPGRSLPSE